MDNTSIVESLRQLLATCSQPLKQAEVHSLGGSPEMLGVVFPASFDPCRLQLEIKGKKYGLVGL